MPHRRPPAAVLHASADDVEAEFYEAMQHGDIDRLMALWADDDEIVYICSGFDRLVGAPAIRAAFETHFAGGPRGPLLLVNPRRIVQIGAELHHVVEQSIPPDGTAWECLASNYYVKTAAGWRLAARHTGQMLALSHMPVDEAPSTRH